MSRPNMLTAVTEIEPLWRDAMTWGHMREDFKPILERLFVEAARGHTHEDAPRLRMSYGKDCDLEKWFTHHFPELAKVRGLGRMMHTDGNVFEAYAIGCLEYALDQTDDWSFDRSWMQKELYMPEEARDEKGHTDGAIFWRGEPYAIVDPKKTKYYAHIWWTPHPPKKENRNGKMVPMKPSMGECRLPPETWGYRHQAGNYLVASGLPFVGFMWLVGFRDDPDTLSIGWAERHELEGYHDKAVQSFDRAELPQPPPPCHEDRGASPCRQWFSKREGTYKPYCDFLDACLDLQQNPEKYQV